MISLEIEQGEDKQWLVGKVYEEKPSLCLRSGNSTAGVRMNAVNSESLNEYFDLLQVFQKISLLTTQKLVTTWMRL